MNILFFAPFRKKVGRSLVIFCLMLLFLWGGMNTTIADSRNSRHRPAVAEDMVVDALVCRPLGMVAVVGGAAFFVITLPFTYFGENVGEAADRFIVDPFVFTFDRPLGDPACRLWGN